MSAPVSLPYRIGRVAWFALIALQVLWHGILARPEQMPTWLVLAITVIPLLLPLIALPNLRRALLWLGILSLFYFCHGVAEAWSMPTQKWLALGEIGLALLVIVTLAAGIKRKPRS